jgi:diguanylate cyclase (GGDEF)-like protein
MSNTDGIQTADGGRGSWPRILQLISTGRARLSARAARNDDTGTTSATVVRLISLLAGLAAMTIAVIVPIAWFLVAEARLRGEVEIQAQLYADKVADEARQNPAFWNGLADSSVQVDMDNVEVARPPAAAEPSADCERWRVFSGSGRIIIETATSVAPGWPLLVARSTVMDGNARLGEVEIARSLRTTLVITGAISVVSAGFGMLLFFLLRILPLRQLDAAIRQASFLSAHDLLTGLPNRRLLYDRLEQALANARRDHGRVAVFCIDVDHFKSINDMFGHAAGDATLRTVATRLSGCLRSSDTLARLGGDEFAVIQPGLRRTEDASILAERLIEAMVPMVDLGGRARHIGLSIGVAVSEPGAPCQLEELMKQADVALYQAKRAGRDRVSFFTDAMNEMVRYRYEMEADLRTALAQGLLSVHYQPQVDMATGRVLGAEALLRWHRPGHGLLTPDSFIDLAEDTGLIVPIGLWVLREACQRATTWPDHIGIAVNVSPVQFRHSVFCQAVIDIVCETGLTPSRLELEVTEEVMLQNTEATLATLNRLHEFGIRLAMDDFGTGYSSLGYLQKFRFDKIKIDRSFTARVDEDSNAEAIVRAVIGMSESLGVLVNAEGVENCAQAEVLRSLGCLEGQGFLYSQPVPGEIFDALLRQGEEAPQDPGASPASASSASPALLLARPADTHS